MTTAEKIAALKREMDLIAAEITALKRKFYRLAGELWDLEHGKAAAK